MGSVRRSCSVCSAVAVAGTDPARCRRHIRKARSGSYSRDAARVRAEAERCYLCGLPFTEADPAVADHVVARARGGSDRPHNLAPAHVSCNAEKSDRL